MSTYRVRVTHDEFADDPLGDLGHHAVLVEREWWGGISIWCTNGEIHAELQHLADPGLAATVEDTVACVRAHFEGVKTGVVPLRSGDAYVLIGDAEEKPETDRYAAWIEGKVYNVELQRLDKVRHENLTSREAWTTQEWTSLDALSGVYMGDDYGPRDVVRENFEMPDDLDLCEVKTNWV